MSPLDFWDDYRVGSCHHLYETLRVARSPLRARRYRFHRVQKAEAGADPVATLQAWIDMDEAIHSQGERILFLKCSLSKDLDQKIGFLISR